MKFPYVLCFALLLVATVTCDDEKTTEESDTCVPGEEYKVGCNDCLCPESGKKQEGSCTLKACPEDGVPTLPPLTSNAEDAEKCEPGTSFSIDSCNTCVCPEDGKKSGAACTALGCGQKPE